MGVFQEVIEFHALEKCYNEEMPWIQLRITGRLGWGGGGGGGGGGKGHRLTSRIKLWRFICCQHEEAFEQTIALVAIRRHDPPVTSL